MSRNERISRVSELVARICKPSEIDVIMTDEEPAPEIRKQFEEQGVELIVC